MITPDDPRHGQTRGYHAGCRDRCCLAAMARYEKGARLDRLHGGRAIPALGYQRRILALVRLGWSYQDIADAAGWSHRNYVRRIISGQKGKPCRWIERATARTIGEVYERLCMTIPQGPYANRTRLHAERKGYAPPLAWDDIDHDPAPRGHYGHDADPDPVVIERILAGDRELRATKAERHEVIRRWSDSINALERLRPDWNVSRDLREMRAERRAS